MASMLSLTVTVSAAGITALLPAVTAEAASTTLTADKTAQWTYQESSKYDLRIHGWSEWENAAYMGFTLPSGFNPDTIVDAQLVVTTVSASNSGTAYVYAADYSAFTSGAQYQGSANAPSYTTTEFTSFTSPTATGEFSIDVTSYIQGLSSSDTNAAFRIDVKSQNTNNAWVIGSCTNSSPAPQLVLTTDSDTGSGILNGTFSSTKAWTISNPSNMSIANGVLTASGSSYESKLSQAVSGMENGTYNLTAYATNTSTDGICYLYAKSNGHTMASTSIPVCSSSTKITVPNVIIEDGTCDIGLYINGSSTVTLDNVSFTECESTRVPFLKGGEISKLTYLEDKGPIKYKDADGTERDCLQIMAENGFNLARIRLLNNPGDNRGDGTYYLPEGYMDIDDCLKLARRAKDKGMQIEFTFAYSDYWSDGATQMPPADWTSGASGLSGSALATYYADKIYAYTKEVLQKLIDQGTEPEFVSIGNEMQYGMCFGLYNSNNGLYNNATYIAQLSNAGAKAVREVCPDARIILHTDNGGKATARTNFIKAISSIDFDVIGVSYYPYYNSDVSIDDVVSEFATLINTYDKDVIIMETGYNWNSTRGDGYEGQLQNNGYYQDIYGETEAGQRAFLTELYAKLKQVAGGRCIGDMYWDPIMAYDNSKWGSTGYNTGWAIKESDNCTQENVVSNSDLFDFDDQILDGILAMKYNTESTDKILVTGTIKSNNKAAANTSVTITADYNDYTVTTDAYGEYIAAIVYPSSGKIGVTASGYSGSYYVDAPEDGVLLSDIDFPSSRTDAIPTQEPKPTATPTPAPTRAPETLVTEDFEGETNIFDVSSGSLSASSAVVYSSGLTGFGNVLAIANSSANAAFSPNININSDEAVTVDFDAFHSYFGYSRTATVSLLNSKGNTVFSYTYNTNSGNVTDVTIGDSTVSGFSAFALRSMYNASSSANGWSGSGKPYAATSGYNPHVSVEITGGGNVTAVFTRGSGSISQTFSSTLGEVSADIAKMTITTNIENADRGYGIDNINIVKTYETFYTVSYSVAGKPYTESVKDGSYASKIPDTTNLGYTFMGWSTDGSSEYDSSKTYLTTDDIKAAAVTGNIAYTAVYTVDSSYIEAITDVSLSGPDSMTFGPNADTAAANEYTVTITGEKGTVITSDTLDSKVTDFKVSWDIDGFKTENDTDGQYCDSYGAFSENNTKATTVNFNLRKTPMNFYGKLTATVTYNGNTYTASKYVVALGDTSVPSNQILPNAGYPSDFNDYPSSLTGYAALKDTYGTSFDTMIGGWAMAGSDSSAAAVVTEEDGNMFMRVTAQTLKKSHVFTTKIASPSSQVIFVQDIRFNSNGGTITFTSGYPMWQDKNYSCPVSLVYNSGAVTLNGTNITSGDSTASISTGTWYKVVLSVDKTTETCYALIYDTAGTLVGSAENVAWAKTGVSPTYYSVGFGSSYYNGAAIDFDNYSAYYPTADTSTYTLSSTADTLSIPNGDTAVLTASLKDKNGYEMTGFATWTVLEEDMQSGVTVTADESDSHTATVSLESGAEAGTATVQVSIGGNTKTIELNITSSSESVKFTSSKTSVSIPLDASGTTTARYSAVVIDSDGAEIADRNVTLAVYDKTNTSEYTLPTGISFDDATGVLTVTASASPCTFAIRATGKNTNGDSISKSVKVTVHGLAFDFGVGSDDDLAEGYTAITADTSYSETRGYGITGTTTAGGSASTTDAASDYLEGNMTFKANVQSGKYYTVSITYQGTLTAEYVNSDLAGYTLGSQTSLSTAEYTVPVVDDVIDLTVADYTSDSVTYAAQIASITITRNSDKSASSKPSIYDIGDSTAANNGSWAYRLAANKASYTELFALADFNSYGKGGTNLGTYYTAGRLKDVLNNINPGDILMLGNMGTNGMGSYFEDNVNYYLDAAEAFGANVILNSYSPHGAVGNYTSGYNSSTQTFTSYRTDSYDVIIRAVAEERAANDSDYIGFVDIGKTADAAFNEYVDDYEANGYASRDAAAQAITACFTDHNHYSNGTLACELMLNGYDTTSGIVSQLVTLLENFTDIPPISGSVNNGSTESNKTLQSLITEASDSSSSDKTVAVTGDAADQGEVTVPADVTVIIETGASLSNSTLTAANSSDDITVKVENNDDTVTVITASTLVFNDAGKLIPSNDAVMITEYTADGKTYYDRGSFIGKTVTESTSSVTYSVTNSDNKKASKTVELGGTVEGGCNILFGLFISGIPENITITSIEIQ